MKKIEEDKFKTLIENVHDLIFLYRLIPEPKFEYVSPSSLEISGYSPEEHYNDPDLFFKLVPLDDIPLLEFIKENPMMIKKPIIMRWKKKDGKVIWTEQRYFNIFNDNGDLIAVEGFVRDITEEKETEFALRESEKKFRELFYHISDMVFLFKFKKTGKGGILIEINDAVCKILEYEREEIFKMDPLAMFGDTKRNEVEGMTKELLKKKQIIFETELTTKNKRKIPVDVSAHYFRLDGEDVTLAIARDITERKKLEKELLKTQKLESISILAGGIAHDFNNILSAILGNISLAKLKVKGNKELLEILSDSEKASMRAKNLTGQLLTFSQGGAPIKKAAYIDELIKNTTIFALRGSNVDYKFHFTKELWPVDVDTDQISQVINNMIINARQAMPDGGLVEISAKNINAMNEDDFLPLKDTNYVKLTIKDNGMGIPKENIHRIFDPFFSTKDSGSGLGLASAYSIIKKHDGYITVESEESSGTTFDIYLPVSKEKNIKDSINNNDKYLKGKGKILIMDDDEDVRLVAGKLIGQLGYEVDFAIDGKKAIKKYNEAKEAKKPFDLIIMDLTIPGGMGGKEAIERLLKIDPKIKAIVSSGYHNDPIVANYKKHGFKGFINKPYTIEELSLILHNLMIK